MNSNRLPTGTVTFLFTDIERSTRLVQALGGRWVPVLEDHNRLVGEAINANGGIVVKTEGDSFFAVFSDAIGALQASLQAQQALMSHPWPPDGLVRTRMGLHTGQGALGGPDYVGLDVHRAARVAAAAHGGQVILSEPTAVLVERHLPEEVTLKDLGKHRLKDLAEPESIFQLLAPGLQAEFPPLRTLDAIPNNLPKLLTSFVGRDKELAEARRLLEASRVLTFTGPGGTGKTRLALQLAADVADDFPDGVFFVDLSPVNDAAVVPSRILDTLGIQASTRDESPEMRLHSQLASRALLLVLDNFEQLLAAAPVVAGMLQASTRTKVVVTTRAPLRIRGEQEMPVPPLGLDGVGAVADPAASLESDAVKLFADRAMAVRPDFAITSENAADVVELVHRLDGLPLAIELVATRLKVLPVHQIIARLDSSLLSAGSVDLPERQRTIRNTISWSHDLLPEPEKMMFARFSVFAGGARLEEVESVCGPSTELGADLLDTLTTLVDHSLVRRLEWEDHPRLRMLHVIGEFAAERLEETGQREEIFRRHLRAYTEYAEVVAPELLRRDRKSWLDLLEEDHDNIRSALDHAVELGEPDLAFRLSSAAWRLWQARGHLDEARARLEQVLALEGGEELNRAKALEALGGIFWWQSDMLEAARVYRETLVIHRRLGDPAEIANALYNNSLVRVFGDTQDLDAATTYLAEAEELYRGVDDPGGLGNVEWARGNLVAYAEGDLPRAIEHMKRSIDYYQQAGNEFGMGWGLFEVGDMFRRIGDHEQSWQYLSRGLTLFADHRDVSGVVLLLASIAGLALALGDSGRAYRLAGAYHELRIKSGTEIVRNVLNRIEGLEYEVLESLTGEDAISYREGYALTMSSAVAYALTGPAYQEPSLEGGHRPDEQTDESGGEDQ